MTKGVDVLLAVVTPGRVSVPRTKSARTEGDGMADHVATASIVEREALLRRHLPLVHRLARRHHTMAPAVDLDDLISWGAMGLLAAVERFDAARDTLFSTYAGFRIRGAILDQLRALEIAHLAGPSLVEPIAKE